MLGSKATTQTVIGQVLTGIFGMAKRDDGRADGPRRSSAASRRSPRHPAVPAGRSRGVAAICLRTAAGGGDATGVYSDDALMPEVYALPYVEYAPDLAFVVDDGGGGRLRARRRRHGGLHRVVPARVGARASARGIRSPDRRPAHPGLHRGAALADGGDPERMRIPELDEYPAHLHIDLLPEFQGRGSGGASSTRCARARRARRARRAPRHGCREHGARAFYDRLGFHELPSSRPDAPRLGIATS